MKKIFRFLGIIAVFSFTLEQAFADGVNVNGNVRYAFELKKLTAQEASQAKTQGYVDLWAYAAFDQAFVDAGYVTLNASGKITRWALLAGDATHSYKIVDKDGNDDRTGSIAMFAAPNSNFCGGRTGIYQQASGGATPKTFIQACPTWAYGSSSSRSSLLDLEVLTDLYCTKIEAEGKTWYCLKLYQVRFEYKQEKSFYVTYYTGSAADGTTSNGASNFNFYAENTETQLLWPGQAAGGDQDWSKTSYWGCIPGGVEIIADPEFTLAASATCGGSDLQGTFKVNNWNGKDWSNYKAVKMYVNTDGGNRKDVTASIAVTPSLPLNSASTTADFSYSLTPSAYMMNGAPADSLIWAFEDTEGKVVEVKTPLTITIVPKVYFAASNSASKGNPIILTDILPQTGGVINVNENTTIFGRATCVPFPAGGTPSGTQISCMSNYKNAYLYRSTTENGAYSPVATPLAGSYNYVSNDHLVPTTGYYFLKLDYNGCEAYTDTVQIKVTKPLAPPSLMLDFQCGTQFSASASVPNDPTATISDWEWVITSSDVTSPANQTSGYGFYITSTGKIGYTNGLAVEFETSSPAVNTSKFILNTSMPGGMSPFCLPFLPIQQTQINSGTATIWNTTGLSQVYLKGSKLWARCKVDGNWLPWTSTTLPAGDCSNGNVTPPLSYRQQVVVTNFSFGISATQCFGNNLPVSCSVDTTLVEGTAIKLRAYFSGVVQMMNTDGSTGSVIYNFSTSTPVALTSGPLQSVVYWQWYNETTKKWETWWTTPATASTITSGVPLHYVESPAITITKTGNYKPGRYRAVFSIAQGCKTVTTTETNSADDEYDPRVFNEIRFYSNPAAKMGNYAEVANVSIKSDVIPGKIKGRIDNTAWNDGPLNMCYSSQLDLKVENYGVPASNLKWQWKQGDNWVDVSPSITGDNYGNVVIGPDGDDIYSGRQLQFRVEATDADGNTGYTDPFTVTVYKARPLSLTYAPKSGSVKDTIAGYCYGTDITVTLNMVLPPPAGVGGGFATQYARSNSITAYSFPNNLTLNLLTTPSTGLNKDDKLNQAVWNFYRPITYNGPSSNTQLCSAIGDTIVVKMNPQVQMGTVNTITEICTNTDTAFTVSGGSNVTDYNWKIQNSLQNNNHTNRLPFTSPVAMNVVIKVQGYGVFGNRTIPDTTVCYANELTTGVKVVVCTKPAPVPDKTAFCLGSTDLKLTWSEAFKAGQTLQYTTDGTTWAAVPTASFTSVVSGTTTEFTIDKSFFTVATGDNTTYKFRILEGTAEGAASVDVTVTRVPKKPTISGLKDESVCENASITFDATVTDKEGTTTYAWLFGTNRIATTEDYTITKAQSTMAGTFKFLAINTIGSCADTAREELTLTVNPAPTKPAISWSTTDPNSASICAGESHKFTPIINPATATPPGSTYTVTWTVPTTPAGAPVGTASGTDNKDYTVTTLPTASTATYNYTIKVKVATTAGCTDSANGTATLKVNARPATPTITNLDDQAGCEGSTVAFNPTVGNQTKMQWYKSATSGGTFSPVSGKTSANLSFSPVATTDAGYYKLLLINDNRTCADSNWSNEAQLTVNPKAIKPVITPFTALNFCQSETGHSLTATVTSAAQTPGSSTQSWYLSNTTGTPVGTGLTYTLPSTTYDNAGTYTYIYKQVNETDHHCKDSAEASVAVTVNANPTLTGVGIAATNDKLCTGETLNLTATPTPALANGVTATYQWYNCKLADTSAAHHVGTNSNTYSVTTATTTPTDYSVRVTYSSGSCFTVVANEKLGIVIVEKPAITSVSVSPTSEEVCQNGTAPTFTATVDPATASAGSYTYKWQRGGTDISGATGLTYTPTTEMATAGTYNYKFIVTATNTQNGHTCTDSKDATATLQVKATPNLSSVTVADQAGCDKVTLTATATPSGSYKYQWYSGSDTMPANIISGATGATYEATTSGNYTVLVIAGANGCEMRRFGTGAATVVTTPAAPTVSLSLNPNQTEFCSGDNLTITASPAPDGTKYTYSWTNPGGTASDNVVTLTNMQTSDAGTYSLSVTETAVNGSTTCTSPAGTASTAITVKQKPVISGEKIDGDEKYCEDETISLTASANSIGKASYNWQYSADGTSFADLNPAQTTAGLSIPNAQTTHSGTYKVVITYTNSTNAANTCEAVAEVTKTVTVNKQPAIGTLTLTSDIPAAANHAVCEGTAVTLTATVTGDVVEAETRTYTWKKGSTVVATNLSDANTDTYTVPATETAGSYTYTCEVSDVNDNCNDSKTETYTFTINAMPTNMQVSVADVSVCSATDLTLTATATADGANPTKYEWFKGTTATGTPVYTSTTAATYTISSAATTDAGDYTVKITFGTGSCEDSKTATAHAYVVPQPQPITVTLNPATKELCTGDNLTITSSLSPADDGSNGTYAYSWSKGTSSNGSMVLSNVTTADAGTYKLTVTATATAPTGAPALTCTDKGEGSSVITIYPQPAITGESLTYNGNGKYCTGDAITLTATGTSVGTASYIWYHTKAADTAGKAIAGATGNTYSPDNTDIASSGDYTVVIIYTNGICQDVKVAECSITLEEQPDITSVTVAADNNPVCVGGSVTLTATVVPGTAVSAAGYTYQWKKGGATLSGETNATLSLSNLSTTDAGSYTCEVTDKNGNCSDTESGSLTLTVTEPANLSNVALTDNKASDSCKNDGDHTLTISGLPSGHTPVYTWTPPAGFTGTAPGTTATSLVVPADMANNGTYKVNIHVAPTPTNPCEADTTLEIDVRFVLCGNEPLIPGTEKGQGDKIALVCQSDAATSAAWVGYTPTDEITAIEKISWYKSTINFTNGGVVDGTPIGTAIAISHPYSWPLKLTQSEVFGSETAPKHYYVRAMIERTGGAVTYSTIYRFALVENAPKITDLSVTPLDDTICLTGSSATETFTAANSSLPAPGSVYGTWGITAKVEGSTGVNYMWKTHNDVNFGSPAASTTKVVTINGVVNQKPTSAKAVSGWFYQVGTTENTCRDTSDEATGKVTTTEPPVITSFLDGDNKNSKTICASEDAANYPMLTAIVPKGEVEKWEWNDGSTWHDITASVTSADKRSYKLTAADMAIPSAGAANITNKYRITVKNGSKCGAVTDEYTLTVVALPDLARVDITPTDLNFCGSGAIVANPKKADGSAASGVVYKWQDSTFAAGSVWTDVLNGTASSQNLSAPDTNFYRCIVTATTTLSGVSCPVSVVSSPVRVRVSENTKAGTAAIVPSAICESQTAEFTLTGYTGSITKIEISNSGSFPAGSNTVEVTPGVTPYTIDPSATDIAALLSTTSRKTTLYVRATVKSGSVCSEVKADIKSVDVYKTAPKLTIDAIDDLCADKSLSAGNGYTPATESFEKIEWKYGTKTDNGTTLYLTYNSLAPKYNADTTYTLTATVTNTVLNTVCGPTASDPVTFKVNRKAVKPAKSNDTAVCAGESYVVSAVRPASSALVWQKDGAALPAGETVVVSGHTESITVSNAAQGKYVYTVGDKTECGQEDVTINVTVNQKPVAGTISVPAGTNGDFCSGDDVKVTADAGTYTLPTGGQITWQVCTDKDNYEDSKQLALEMTGNAYSKPSTAFTPGTIYYIRYGVSGPTCETVYSDWQAVKVIAKPSIGGFTVSSGNNEHICVGTEVNLIVSGSEGLKYEIFSNTANSTTGGTSVKTGYIDATGSASVAVTPSATTYYYAVLTDTSYHSTVGSCGTSAPSTVMTVNVDALNVGGKLVFTNTDITGQPTDGGKKLEGNVGEHTAQLRLDGATGNTKTLVGESDKGVAVPGKTINPTASLPLSTDHMDKTLLWVVVSGGECPDAYSDTVELTVKVGTVPTLSVTSPICQGSASTLTIAVPEFIRDKLVISSLEYQENGSTTWTTVSSATFGSVTGTAPNLRIAVTETLTQTLAAGNYKFRFKYKLGTDGDETLSNEAPLQVDAHSVGGTIAASATIVCQNGDKPVISLSGYTGEIQATYFGTASNNISQSVSSVKDETNLYEVPTADLSRSGWYQVRVKNGSCPEAKSDSIEVRVIETPVAGSLSDATLCFNNGTQTLTLSGNKGDSIIWKTASAATGSYTDVPNANQTTWAVGPLTDHLFVKVAVTTNAVCAPVESALVEVKVYDTLTFTTHPHDVSVVVGNPAVLTAAADNSGLKYDNGTGAAFESNMPATYQWQMLEADGTTWNNISDGSDFTGTQTASLTILAANAENYVGKYFRCVATDAHCNRQTVSNRATIKLLADLEPGETHSLTACECYYSTDEATYYVTGADGQGTLKFKWQVSRDNTNWLSIESVFPDGELATVCKGYESDTIVFFEIGKLYNDKAIRFIRAWVSDSVNTEGLATTGEAVDVCMADKPVYTFAGNIVCERDAAGNAVNFAFTANPPTIDGREIKYAYALHSDPANFTAIANGTSVAFDGGKSLSFALDASDNLTIPASSAIPFEADSMVLRMEVRSCYTPEPLATNTDTTIYAVLRVDKTPEIDLLRDTTVCKGSDVELVAAYTLYNSTIPGNKISVSITPGGPSDNPDAVAPAEKTLPYTVPDIQTTTTFTATVKTAYCAEKTDNATITVVEIPVLVSVSADSVCEGSSMNFVADVTNYNANTCKLIWQKWNTTANAWDSVGTGTTYTKANAATGDAGKYRLHMEVLVPSCAETINEEFDFKVKVVPELYLTPNPYPGNIMVQKTKDRTITAQTKTVAEMGYDPAYVILADITGYEWYVQQKPAATFDKLTGSNHGGLVNSAVDKEAITLVGSDEYDSTLFYAKAITACGDVETKRDTLRVTEKFSITSVVPTTDLLCANDAEAEFVIEVATSLPPLMAEGTGWKWQVSTNNGTNWTDITAGPVAGQSGAEYIITAPVAPDGTNFSLTVKHPTLAMSGWKFRAWATDGTDSDTTTRVEPVNTLQVIPAPAFTCADNAVLERTQPVVVIGGTPATSDFTAKASCLPSATAPDPGYQYQYWVREPGADDSTQWGTGSSYTFSPTTATGMYEVYFVITNQCGDVTAMDSVRAIEKPEPGTVTAVGQSPDGTVIEGPVGPLEDNISIDICANNRLELSATYTGGPAEDFTWQYSQNGTDWSTLNIASPYSLRNDTLIIDPVPVSISGYKYRCLFDMPDSVADIVSQEITVTVSGTPNVANTWVSIMDVTPEHASRKLDTGQALPGATIELTAEGLPDFYDHICFYQAFLNENGEIDSVEELHCGTETVYELTKNATVAEHDATWYYVQVWNKCGYDSTRAYQLRIFDTLNICWIPDTIIENPSGGWDPASNTDPEPGELIVVVRPGEDSVQVAAHLWLCQTSGFFISDTTKSGFMNRETYETEETVRGSRWLYRSPDDDEWLIINPDVWPWGDLQSISYRVDEHTGKLVFPLPADPNMDGWQFRALGMNALYKDTTCILTLHVIPSLEDGTLQMEPELIEACSETFAEFRVTSETADLSKLVIDWQVKAATDADWSANIDSLHNDTIYTIGLVGVDYDGYQVRAIGQGPCGNDTVEGRIVITAPLHPGVTLTADTVCFGEPLTITAQDTGNAGHIRFIWYVDGTEVPDVDGETLDMSGYDAGTYGIRVVMIADTNTNACVIPKQASATDTAVVRPLPTVEAFIADTLIKTGFSTEVWATGNGTGYSWTPADYVENADAERTATVEFDHAGTYTFVVTATNEFGCEASDSVKLEVLSNFKLDSIPTTVVTPPILPNDDGSMPGLPDGSYPMNGEGVDVVNTTVFYEDEAHLWVCPGNEARVVIATSGGEKPIDYIWSREDGTAYPRDYKDTLTYYTEPNGIPEGWDGYGASTADYTIQDSIIVFFFPDSTTHQFNCRIVDAAGSELDITVHVHYYVPELIYIETRPKTTSTKFYEDQAVYFHARPQRYPDYYWIRLAGPEEDLQVTDMRASKEAMYPTSFKMENPDETHNQVWVSAIDRHGCRIWDSTSVQLMKLPNVMIIDDPTRPLGGIIFPEFEVEITNMWGLRIKAFRDRNGNGSTRGWDGRTPSGKKVTAGTYYYKVKIPTLDGFVYMSGAVTVVNR